MNVRGRRLIVLLATVVGIAATAELGLWQWRRATEKIALQEALDSRAGLPELRAEQLASTAAGAESQHYRRVRLTGHWVSRDTVFLDNRQMNGQPGFFVVTPLKLAGRDDAVLVQRGWAPRHLDDRTALPKLVDATGEVEVLGLVAPPPGRLLDLGAPNTGSIRQNLPLDAYARETGLALRPLSIEQGGSPSTAGDGLQRTWPRPALDVDRHWGYMGQWFGLSALLAGLYLWFQIIAPLLLARRLKRGPQADANSTSSSRPPLADAHAHDA